MRWNAGAGNGNQTYGGDLAAVTPLGKECQRECFKKYGRDQHPHAPRLCSIDFLAIVFPVTQRLHQKVWCSTRRSVFFWHCCCQVKVPDLYLRSKVANWFENKGQIIRFFFPNSFATTPGNTAGTPQKIGWRLTAASLKASDHQSVELRPSTIFRDTSSCSTRWNQVKPTTPTSFSQIDFKILTYVLTLKTKFLWVPTTVQRL